MVSFAERNNSFIKGPAFTLQPVSFSIRAYRNPTVAYFFTSPKKGHFPGRSSQNLLLCQNLVTPKKLPKNFTKQTHSKGWKKIYQWTGILNETRKKTPTRNQPITEKYVYLLVLAGPKSVGNEPANVQLNSEPKPIRRRLRAITYFFIVGGKRVNFLEFGYFFSS